jgi:hypothetical protein
MPKKELFVVERILDKRKHKNKVEYLIKWKNYGESENTWESANSFLCPDLVQEYEEKCEKKETKEVKKVRKESDDSESTIQTINENEKEKEEIKTSEDSLIAEEILGAGPIDGELNFLVKWKNTDDADIVPAKIANVKYPQHVIKFYEKRLNWKNSYKN